MLLTIKNYKKLEGTKYNTDYYFKTITETDRCYTFILETNIRNGGYRHQIDVHRKGSNGKWRAEYMGNAYNMELADLQTPYMLIRAFQRF